MRKRKKVSQLSLKSQKRQFLLGSLLNNFLKTGRIRTTLARAKAVRPLVEKFLTQAKKEAVTGEEKIIQLRKLRSQVATDGEVKLALEMGKVIKGRNGGYIRIVKLARRISDSAPMAVFELVDRDKLAGKDQKKPNKKAKVEKAAQEEEKSDKKVGKVTK